MGREECEALAKRVLSFATADETRVTINSGGRGNTRFAVNQISTGGDNYDATVTVRSTFGKRTRPGEHEQARRREPQGGRAARRAAREAVARRSGGDARARPADVRRVERLERDDRVARSECACERGARDHGARARRGPRLDRLPRDAGRRDRGRELERVCSPTAKQTALALTTTVRTDDGTGSGWAGATSHDFATARSGRARRARDRQGATIGESGRHRAGTLHRRSSSRPPSGISCSSSRRDERAQRRRRSLVLLEAGRRQQDRHEGRRRARDDHRPIRSIPRHTATRSRATVSRSSKTTWIENGVVKNLQYDRYWAQKQGKHADSATSGTRAHVRRHDDRSRR